MMSHDILWIFMWMSNKNVPTKTNHFKWLDIRAFDFNSHGHVLSICLSKSSLCVSFYSGGKYIYYLLNIPLQSISSIQIKDVFYSCHWYVYDFGNTNCCINVKCSHPHKKHMSPQSRVWFCYSLFIWSQSFPFSVL